MFSGFVGFPFSRYAHFASFVSLVHVQATQAASQDSGTLGSTDFAAILQEVFRGLYGVPLSDADYTTTFCALLASGYRSHSSFSPPAGDERDGRSVLLVSPPRDVPEPLLRRAFQKYAASEAF